MAVLSPKGNWGDLISDGSGTEDEYRLALGVGTSSIGVAGIDGMMVSGWSILCIAALSASGGGWDDLQVFVIRSVAENTKQIYFGFLFGGSDPLLALPEALIVERQ